MATICRPLTALTQKDRKELVWSSECDEAFNNIIVTASLLHPTNVEKEFFLWTDASKKGFGAILKQERIDKLQHPVPYASRPTNNEVCWRLLP